MLPHWMHLYVRPVIIIMTRQELQRTILYIFTSSEGVDMAHWCTSVLNTRTQYLSLCSNSLSLAAFSSSFIGRFQTVKWNFNHNVNNQNIFIIIKLNNFHGAIEHSISALKLLHGALPSFIWEYVRIIKSQRQRPSICAGLKCSGVYDVDGVWSLCYLYSARKIALYAI